METNKNNGLSFSQAANEIASLFGDRIREEWRITRYGQISRRTPFVRKIRHIFEPLRQLISPPRY